LYCDEGSLAELSEERFSTFLAVYSDDAAIREAFAGIASDRPNVINLYRTLFDARFGAGAALGPLADRSYFVRWQRPQRPELLSEPDREAACVARVS
jgi:hypothetical protein